MDTQQTPPEVVQGIPSGATPAFDAKDIQDNKFIAALSYINILVLIPLFLARKSAFAQEHAKQGLVIFIVSIIGWVVFWIPLLGWLLALIIAIGAIVAFVKCLMGEFWEIPVLGVWRKKIHLEKL
jgi:uncharacterized membrane protein